MARISTTKDISSWNKRPSKVWAPAGKIQYLRYKKQKKGRWDLLAVSYNLYREQRGKASLTDPCEVSADTCTAVDKWNIRHWIHQNQNDSLQIMKHHSTQEEDESKRSIKHAQEDDGRHTEQKENHDAPICKSLCSPSLSGGISCSALVSLHRSVVVSKEATPRTCSWWYVTADSELTSVRAALTLHY